MKMKKIKLKNGYAFVPMNAIIINLTDGKGVDIGIIKDTYRKLPDLYVVSEKEFGRMSVKEENQLIDKAIEHLPEYREVRLNELPFPQSENLEEGLRWFESRKLYFNTLVDTDDAETIEK